MAHTLTQTNKLHSLNYRDLLRGLLIAALTAVITSIYEGISQGGFDNIEWKETLAIGVTAGLSYLIKNFFTPTEIVVVNPPQTLMEKVKEGGTLEVGGHTIPALGTKSKTVNIID